MGLLDTLFSDPQQVGLLSMATGLMSAGGPSRTPVSLGQAMAQGYNNGLQGYALMQKEKREQAQQDLINQQVEMAKQKLAMEKELQDRQNTFLQNGMGIIGRMSAPPTPYTDQMKPQDVGSTELPQVPMTGPDANQGTPDDYFRMVGKIPDPKEKLAAAEAGFRRWPEYRPQVKSADSMDAATQLATLGSYGSLAGIKGADALISAAKYFEPQKMDSNAWYRNPVTGSREFIGQVAPGMTYDSNGKAVNINGYAQALAAQKAAEAGGTESGKAPYGEPVVLKGVGSGGSDVVIPRVNMPGLNGAITSRSPIGIEGEKEFNANWIKNTYQPVQESAKAADSMLTQVQTFRNIPIGTGWGTETKAAGANILAGLGIAPKNAEMLAANGQKFQQTAMERLWTVLNAAKGPQTEGDAQRASQTFVKLGNTPEANQFIADLAEATANRDKLKAAYYQDAYELARQTGDYGRVDREWRKIQRSIWSDPVMKKWEQR